MSVKHSKDIPSQDVPAGENTSMQVLISSGESPNFAMRKFTISPGGGMPEHTNRVEHEQYILKGQAAVGIAGEVYQVHQGDAVFIPQGARHWYRNNGDEPFEFLCMVPNTPDEIKVIQPGC